MLLSRHELNFKFNRLYIISENISHLGAFLYRIGTAIVYDVFNNVKLADNIV